MPYEIVKDAKKGYYVIDISGKKYSKKPLSLARAKRQLAALHIHTGHGLDNIVMPKKDFIKEHHKLLNVLKSQDPTKLNNEYKEQSKELKKVLQGGIAVKLVKYSDGSYGVSDMKGNVLEHGLNKQDAEKALTKWYKYSPPPPVVGSEQSAFRKVVPTRTTIGSEQSAFRKVKKGGITAAKFDQFNNNLAAQLDAKDVGMQLYADGHMRIDSETLNSVFLPLVQKYFHPLEFEEIRRSRDFENIQQLEQDMNIFDYINLVRHLYPGSFDGIINGFLEQFGKIRPEEQYTNVSQFVHSIMRVLYTRLVEKFVDEPIDSSKKFRKEFSAAGKVTGSGVHKRNLLAAHNQFFSTATPAQRERIAQVYFQALAELNQAPKSRSLMDKLKGRPMNEANNTRKLNIVANATQRMNQIMNEGLIPNPLHAIPRPPGRPPTLQGPLLPNGFFSPRYMGPAFRTRAPSTATESSSSESDYNPSPVASHRSSMSSHSTEDPGPDDGVAGTEVFPRLVTAAGKHKKKGGITPEQKAQLELELKKLDTSGMRLQLYVKNREQMNKAILARDPELTTNKKKYLENLISINEHLIKSGHMLLRMYDIAYTLGDMSEEEYKADKQQDTETIQNREAELAEATNQLKELKGKGKDDDDKFKLIQQLEIQLINLLRGRQLEKDYDQIDALITNLKSEAESFLVRPGAKLENKDYIRDMLHRVLPSFITALAKIPKQGGELSKGSGYYQDELQRRMQRFPEHIANPIIQRTLPQLEEIGPSRANLLKGRLFGNPQRQQRKHDIIDNAINEAQIVTERRRRRRLPIGSTYITSMEDIANNDEVIDYANNSISQVYHSPADWEAWRVSRAQLRQPFNDPYSSVIVNPRNIERFTAEILPEEVAYKKYREGTDTWYQPIDDKGNPIGKPSWEKPPIETGQKYRPRAPTIELSEPDIHIVAESADKPIPIAYLPSIAQPAQVAHPAPFSGIVATPNPLVQRRTPNPLFERVQPNPIAHPAPFDNIVATLNPLVQRRTPNPLFQPYTASGKFSEDDMLIGDNLLVGGKVRFSDHKTFVQWLNAMFYELLTKPISERNNLFKARTEIRTGLPSWDESIRTFIVYDRAGRFLSLKTYPMEEFDDRRRYFMNKDNEIEWGFPFIKTDYSALKRDKPLDDNGVWKSRTDGLDLYFTRIPTPLDYPLLGTPSSSPSSSPKAKNSSSPREGPGGFAPGSGPVSLVSASEMAGGPPPPVPGTEGPNAKNFREHVMKIFGWSEEKVKANPEYQRYLAKGEGKVKFVKKYLKGQGLPATKKNVAKICDIMDTEGIVFEGNK